MMMVMLPPNGEFEQGALPSAELVGEMTRFNEEMAQAGVMLSGEGLHPSAKGARVENLDGEKVVTDGPFVEKTEILGGYWTIRVDSKEEAVAWAKRVPGPDMVIELRRIFDPSDFPADVQAAAESPILDERLRQNLAP